jgi:hypothetical protein
MKTLKNKKGTKFVRVPDKKGHEISGIKELIAKGWEYCPKSEWKQKARDVDKSKPKPKAKKVPKKP